MENLTLYVMTTIVILAFCALIFGTYQQYTKMDNDPYTGAGRADSPGGFFNFLSKLFG